VRLEHLLSGIQLRLEQKDTLVLENDFKVCYQLHLFELFKREAASQQKLGYEPNLKPKGEQLLGQERKDL
jgi:hypothetical protein